MKIVGPVLTIASVVSACTTTRALQRAELASQPLPRVWVTRADHTKVVMTAPQVTGDTLVGTVGGVRQQFLLFETPEVSTREFSKGRTALLVASAVGLGTLAYFASTWHPKSGKGGIPVGVCACDSRIDSICGPC